MIIIGAKGFAKEVLEELIKIGLTTDLAFYDDVSSDVPNLLFEKFTVLRNLESVQNHFEKTDNKFTIGIGIPSLRKKLCTKFENIGGELISVISPDSKIGHFDVNIKQGCNIMTNSIISNSVQIGKGCIIYFNTVVAHDCAIGDFVELSPGVHISGNCTIGDYTSVGTNATLIPKITLGKNVIVAAGSVVTKDVPDYCMVAGVPAVIKKELKPLDFE